MPGTREPRVYNFGRGSYYSSQERILFEQLAVAGHVPDLAVFIDGGSDFVFAHTERPFASNAFAGFANGLFVSLFFYVKFRESQAAAALHKAEVERHLLSKQAIEAELRFGCGRCRREPLDSFPVKYDRVGDASDPDEFVSRQHRRCGGQAGVGIIDEWQP